MQNKKYVKVGQQLPNNNLKSCKWQIELVYCNKSLFTHWRRGANSTQPTLVAFRYTSVETLDRYATNVKGICGSLCATGWTHICTSCCPSRCISRSQVGHKQEQNLHGHRASWIHMTTASSNLANPLSLNFPISNVCPESVPPQLSGIEKSSERKMVLETTHMSRSKVWSALDIKTVEKWRERARFRAPPTWGSHSLLDSRLLPHPHNLSYLLSLCMCVDGSLYLFYYSLSASASVSLLVAYLLPLLSLPLLKSCLSLCFCD